MKVAEVVKKEEVPIPNTPSKAFSDLTAEVQEIRNEAFAKAGEDVKSLLEEHMNQSLIQGIEGLDKKQLVERIKLIASEMNDRTSLEAVRSLYYIFNICIIYMYYIYIHIIYVYIIYV